MKIAVVTNPEKDDKFIYTRLICSRLMEFGADVLIPSDVWKDAPSTVQTVSKKNLYKSADVIAALGGDGTILHAAKEAAMDGVPVLGINIGRLGFMAGIEVDELDGLKKLTDGNFSIDERMILKIEFKNRPGLSYYALNDAVISKGTLSRIIDISLSCNERQVGEYRADGVIISTPTGSTAYSLSAGGPVIDPVIESIAVTPICPHSLFGRTVLFAPKTVIGIEVKKLSDREAYLTIDGQDSLKLAGNEKVIISKARKKARLIRLKDISFYEVLYNKFMERGV